MDELAEWAVRWRPSTAIDIGCGPGSFSIALAARAPVSVRAIDLNAEFLERGRSTAQATSPVGKIDFIERPLQENEGEFDLVACIGSSGAVGKPCDALHRCKSLLTQDGTLVFAELVWTAEPPEEFLSFLGIEGANYWLQSSGKTVFAQHGLSLMHQCDASPSSWDSYERAVLDGRLKLAATLNSDDSEAVRSRASTWYTNFEKYGRFCLGFTAYVARLADA